MKNILFKKFVITGVLSGVLFSILFSIPIFLFSMITEEITDVSFISLLGFNLYGYAFLGLIFGIFAYSFRDRMINKKIFKYILLVFSSFLFNYAIFSLFMFNDLIFLSPIFFILMTHIIFIWSAIDFFSVNSFNLFFLSSTFLFLFVVVFEGIVFAYLFNYFIEEYSNKQKNIE